jgi:hypothetical protein
MAIHHWGKIMTVSPGELDPHFAWFNFGYWCFNLSRFGVERTHIAGFEAYFIHESPLIKWA